MGQQASRPSEEPLVALEEAAAPTVQESAVVTLSGAPPCASDAPAFKVVDAGLEEFNGTYVPDGYGDGATRYRKSDGGEQTVNRSQDGARWFIGHNHGGRWYEVRTPDSTEVPPETGWTVCPHGKGRKPAPHLIFKKEGEDISTWVEPKTAWGENCLTAVLPSEIARSFCYVIWGHKNSSLSAATAATLGEALQPDNPFINDLNEAFNRERCRVQAQARRRRQERDGIISCAYEESQALLVLDTVSSPKSESISQEQEQSPNTSHSSYSPAAAMPSSALPILFQDKEHRPPLTTAPAIPYAFRQEPCSCTGDCSVASDAVDASSTAGSREEAEVVEAAKEEIPRPMTIDMIAETRQSEELVAKLLTEAYEALEQSRQAEAEAKAKARIAEAKAEAEAEAKAKALAEVEQERLAAMALKERLEVAEQAEQERLQKEAELNAELNDRPSMLATPPAPQHWAPIMTPPPSGERQGKTQPLGTPHRARAGATGLVASPVASPVAIARVATPQRRNGSVSSTSPGVCEHHQGQASGSAEVTIAQRLPTTPQSWIGSQGSQCKEQRRSRASSSACGGMTPSFTPAATSALLVNEHLDGFVGGTGARMVARERRLEKTPSARRRSSWAPRSGQDEDENASAACDAGVATGIGSGLPLHPFGAYWDWPLSRVEMKARVAMVNLFMLWADKRALHEQLERLHATACAASDPVEEPVYQSWEWPLSRHEKKGRVDMLDKNLMMADRLEVLEALDKLKQAGVHW
mmetsp:Transcript_12070/g.27084  ORF Transcript_12070/g.27084 Transcript_12070/m.27084 type:complete len:753 (+) Transcript_12070:93-2351(+)